MSELHMTPYGEPRKHTPKGLQVLVAGFTEQTNLITNNDVLHALELLPRGHLRGLKVVRYDPQRKVQRAVLMAMGEPFDPRADASFLYGAVEGICIYTIRSRTHFFQVLLHEIAHHVYYKVIPDTYRDRWQDQYPGDAFVSQQASKNVFEDFAECYAHFMLNPEKLKQIPAKFHYMNDYIFAPYYTQNK